MYDWSSLFCSPVTEKSKKRRKILQMLLRSAKLWSNFLDEPFSLSTDYRKRVKETAVSAFSESHVLYHRCIEVEFRSEIINPECFSSHCSAMCLSFNGIHLILKKGNLKLLWQISLLICLFLLTEYEGSLRWLS